VLLQFNGNLYAIDIQNGNVIWKYYSGARIIMAPSAVNGNIYFGNLAGELFCISDKGDLIWKISTGGILNATPFATENFLIVPDMDKKFYFVDIKSGKIVKTYNVDGRIRLSPVIFRNILLIGYGRGDLQAYEFK
jgi:outer membrane protein assembly factor BamB